MNIRPINDKIIVKAQEPETQTAGGILIASGKNEGVVKGTIVAVGPGKHNEKGEFVSLSVQEGNEILFNVGSGYKFEHNDEELISMTENEIIAVLS